MLFRSAVVIVTVAAVLAGWIVKSEVVNRSVPFESSGIQAALPAGWIQSGPQGDLLVEARQRNTLEYQTTYAITKMLMSADSGQMEAVSLVTLQQAQSLNSYRVLDQRAVIVGGRDAYEVHYVFVESNSNVTRNELPVIVLGVDYYFFTPEGAVIVTYRAAEANYQNGLVRFHLFLESIQLQGESHE